MQIELGKPQPKQVEFLTATNRYVAYGGARGGGKSWTVRYKAVVLALRYSGIKILIIRRTYDELRTNHIEPLRLLLKDVARYNDTSKTLRLPNNSVIQFGYLANSADLLRYQGQEYDVIFIDEATQVDFDSFDALKACVRGVNDFPKRIYLTCNPGGVGHAWVKRLFVDREFLPGEDPKDYLPLIKATVYDNKALLESDREYVKQLESYTGDRRRAWLEGEWDVYDGLFFKEFRRDVHVVKGFVIPRDWKRYRVFDYGMDMLACLWIAVDYEGNAYVYKELNVPDLIISAACERIGLKNGDDEIACTYAPSDLWSRSQETGRSRAEIFSENGLPLVEVKAGRIAGWYAVREYLKAVPQSDGRISSRLKIFEDCKLLIRHLAEIQYDEKDVEDAATEPHELTHNVDALRYFCVSRPCRPQEARVPRYLKDVEDYDEEDELEVFLEYGGD